MDAITTAINLIQNEEGFRTQAYKCPAGIWTIGYGLTSINGRPIQPGQLITQPQAELYLKQRVAEIKTEISSFIKVPLNDNQLAALISFAYNIGIGAFKTSTLARLLNKKNYSEAANEFPKWVHANHGEVLPGLVIRRQKEKELFLS